MTHELEKLQRKGTKSTCPICHATVLSSSQPNLMGTTTDISQELAQQIPDNNDMITMQMHVSKRAAVLAALAATPADDAVNFIRVVGEELVNAGMTAGDRSVILENIRSLIAATPAVERKWIIDLIHSEYDPKPSDYRPGDNWNDGAEEIADQILERLRNV